MSLSLKPLDQQVMVITGASSGIGLATAEAAAAAGVALALTARSISTLEGVVSRIEADGGEAIALEGDVSDRRQMEDVARAAVDRFGRIDSWVNNAGVSIYGRLEEVTEEDRKSTRLNSSHVKISYAVFCLKKKNRSM